MKDKEASQDPTAGESYAECKKPSAYENQAAADKQVAGEELAWSEDQAACGEQSAGKIGWLVRTHSW